MKRFTILLLCLNSQLSPMVHHTPQKSISAAPSSIVHIDQHTWAHPALKNLAKHFTQTPDFINSFAEYDAALTATAALDAVLAKGDNATLTTAINQFAKKALSISRSIGSGSKKRLTLRSLFAQQHEIVFATAQTTEEADAARHFLHSIEGPLLSLAQTKTIPWGKVVGSTAALASLAAALYAHKKYQALEGATLGEKIGNIGLSHGKNALIPFQTALDDALAKQNFDVADMTPESKLLLLLLSKNKRFQAVAHAQLGSTPPTDEAEEETPVIDPRLHAMLAAYGKQAIESEKKPLAKHAKTVVNDAVRGIVDDNLTDEQKEQLQVAPALLGDAQNNLLHPTTVRALEYAVQNSLPKDGIVGRTLRHAVSSSPGEIDIAQKIKRLKSVQKPLAQDSDERSQVATLISQAKDIRNNADMLPAGKITAIDELITQAQDIAKQKKAAESGSVSGSWWGMFG